MKTPRKNTRFWVGVLLGSGLVTLYTTLYLFYYYVGIFCVHPGSFGELIWCTGEAGTFFPLPREAGYEAVITSRSSVIDYLLYLTVVATKLIYGLPLIFGGLTLFAAWTLYRQIRET